MSNNTPVSGITKPTEYTLLDNNHKYLPRDFTFIPTVSSKSDDNDITKTVENALTNTNYYTCTPQDFVYKIEVKNNSNSVVYKTENKSAFVYKISSGGNDVYKYCESNEVDISVLGDANINIGNVTVTKDNNVLEPIAKSLSCTEPDATKEITVPKDYGSLEINSSDVYFRQESSSDSPSWVIIKNNGKQVSSNIQTNSTADITFTSQNNLPTITNKNIKYSVDNTFLSPLETAKNNLETAENKNNLETAENDLETAENDLETAKNDLTSAKELLKRILYVENEHSSSFDSLVTLATKCKSFYEKITNNTFLPEPIQALGNPNSKVSEIFSNFENAENLLNDQNIAQESLKTASNYLGQVIYTLNTLNNLPNAPDNYTYITDDTIANNLVGVITDSRNLDGFFIYEWLDKLLKYCRDNPSNTNFNFLDANREMIICQKTNNNNNDYDLVYLKGYGQNGDRILPDGDFFNSITEESTSS